MSDYKTGKRYEDVYRINNYKIQKTITKSKKMRVSLNNYSINDIKITYADEDVAYLEDALGGFYMKLKDEPLKGEIRLLMETKESVDVNLTFTKFGRYISDIIESTPIGADLQDDIEPTVTLPVMTRDYVRRYSGKDKCYIIIDKKVYDVSFYLPIHPGT